MVLDLSKFHQAFFEECTESLDNMESTLLGLVPGGDYAEAINTIFRGAHSIKGGAATLAFQDIAAFTHAMETLLDRIRDGSRALLSADVDLLLQCVDAVRDMLAARQHGTTCDSDRVADLRSRLEASLEDRAPRENTAAGTLDPEEITEEEFEALLDQLHGTGNAPGVPRGETSLEALSKGEESRTTLPWRIVFRPRAGLFHSGNDPLRIFRELESLGALAVTADLSALPAFDVMDPEVCYLAWDLELRTDAPREKIAESFSWVEGECELKIESGGRSLADAGQKTEGRPVEAEDDFAASTPPVPQTYQRSPATDHQSESVTIRVAIDKIDALINMVGELVITQSMLSQLSNPFDVKDLPKLKAGLAQLERNTRELQESVMRIRMLPISFAFNRLPRLVRDLSARLGKKVELKLTGENTELDKTVMEKIGDPLVHLVRNALDHGIEKPEQRRAVGKPETGTLHLDAYHHSGSIVIEISDNGAGLDKEKILAKACSRGLVKDEAGLTDSQIYELIFLPGFSTADQVSDVSGRGVGMDVVRRNIKALGGSVEVRSQAGQGTTITIRLPLTLAILDGQIVRVGNEIYIIPLVSIVESVKIRNETVNLVAGRGEVIRLRDEYLQVLRLYQVFDTTPSYRNLADGLLVVVEGEGLKVGLFVDELLGQQQFVIKSLEANFTRIEGISGATILGDGTVSLILDIPGLIKLAHRNAPAIGASEDGFRSPLAA